MFPALMALLANPALQKFGGLFTGSKGHGARMGRAQEAVGQELGAGQFFPGGLFRGNRPRYPAQY